jgi:hypothetical protein
LIELFLFIKFDRTKGVYAYPVSTKNVEEAALKNELHDKIDHADFKQLNEIYSLLINYFNSNDTTGDCDTLSDYRKERINKSMEQANAGLYAPAKEAVERIQEKYGLNG